MPSKNQSIADFYEPVNGYFELPTGPGFGYAIDPAKVISRTEL